MKGRELRKAVGDLLDGLGVTEYHIGKSSKHARLHFIVNGHELSYTIAGTPGDRRAWNNLKADIRLEVVPRRVVPHSMARHKAGV